MKHGPLESKERNQLELLPSQRAVQVEITPEILAGIRTKPTFQSAWNYAQDLSGLENKFVSGELDMDESQWNKVRKGINNPPADERFCRYRKVVGNHVLLAWHCESEGFDFLSMRRHRNSLERENEELKEELAAHKRALRLVMEAQK